MISLWHLKRAVSAVSSSGVIAYPTEAVYGLGCDPLDPFAIQRLLAMKHRPVKKGLILIASQVEQLLPFIHFPNETIHKEVLASWPGPYSWILPATDLCPVWLRGQHAGLAVRVTNHPCCRALCDRVGALVSTSANRAGAEPARSALQVRRVFGDEVSYVLNDALGAECQPSSIRDALTGKKLR